jgi:hypothetical protein
MLAPMLDWLVIRAAYRNLLPQALPRAWRGGEAIIVDLAFPPKSHPVTFVMAAGCAPARAARWPDVLVEWAEIYDEQPFGDRLLPVAAEELSGLGADVLVTRAELGLKKADVAWYEKGAVRQLEHVGSSQLAWNPEDGLGRPESSSLALAGGKLAARLSHADKTADLLERLSATSLAVAEAILTRAHFLILDGDPPPMDQLAGIVGGAPAARFRL